MASAMINEPAPAGNPILSVESLPSITYKGHPVVTTKILANLYGTDEANIRQNLSRNRSRFVEGKHFFFITGDELRSLKNDVTISHAVGISPRVNNLTAWTSQGSARHAKMLDTDKAWDVFELLEESYFHRQQAPAIPTGTLTASQQQEIKELVQAKASVFPDAVKRKVFSQIWMRIQRKFKVPRYEELPASLFGEARDYVIAMQIRSVEAPALVEAETPALPPARTRNTLDDYKALYRALPGTPQYFMDLLAGYAQAYEVVGRKLEEVKAEATKPFRVNRKSGVSTYFDSAMSPMYSLFENAEKAQHLAYCQVFDALNGCRNIWMLLHKG